jgi:hypothetical protein
VTNPAARPISFTSPIRRERYAPPCARSRGRGRLPPRRGKAEGAGDEGYVVVDRLRYTHDGERVPAPARFLVKLASTALRAVAADREEDIHATAMRLSTARVMSTGPRDEPSTVPPC